MLKLFRKQKLRKVFIQSCLVFIAARFVAKVSDLLWIAHSPVLLRLPEFSEIWVFLVAQFLSLLLLKCLVSLSCFSIDPFLNSRISPFFIFSMTSFHFLICRTSPFPTRRFFIFTESFHSFYYTGFHHHFLPFHFSIPHFSFLDRRISTQFSDLLSCSVFFRFISKF